MTNTFEALALRDELLQSVANLGFTTPSPIQVQAIPHLLEGRDVLGQAQTGTGKTAAFGFPLLQQIDYGTPHIQALVLTPTRELAVQVANALYQYGQFLKVRVLPIYGGQSYTQQHRRLAKGAEVVVATPGRLIDLMNQGVIDLTHVKFLVLDEADEMLRMGFIEDVQKILSAVPTMRQTALFSATLPKEVRDIATRFMNAPVHVAIQKEAMTVQQIEQRHYLVHPDSKIPALSRLLETEDMQSALIFTRTRADSAMLAEALLKRGYMADSISGDLSQDAREAVLRRFRNGDLPILVATDVVARGVDIPQVSHVFNFDMPQDDDDYVHRIGRTGRAGRSGIAITLVTPREVRRMAELERFIKQAIPRVQLPRLEDIRLRRDQKFAKRLEEVVISGEKEIGESTLAHFINAGFSLEDVASAAIQLARMSELDVIDHVKSIREEAVPHNQPRERGNRNNEGGRRRFDDERVKGATRNNGGKPRSHEAGMARFVIDIGNNDRIRPGDIVGTVAALTGIEGKSIGAIRIQDTQTFFDVPEASVEKVMKGMARGKVRGKAVKLTLLG